MASQMIRRLGDWLNGLPLHDPIERQQALTLQTILLILAATSLLLMLQSLADLSAPLVVMYRSGANLARLTIIMGALFALRRARLQLAVVLTALGVIGSVTAVIIPLGFPDAGGVAAAYLIPLALIGILSGRRALISGSALVLALIVGIALLQRAALAGVAWAIARPDPIFITLTGMIVTVVTLALILDRFGSSLRDALVRSQAHERELQQLHDAQEQLIAERTAQLQEALGAVQAREQELVQTLAELQASKAVIRELSVPVIPVLPRVVMVPLIGELDEGRSALLIEHILPEVERQHATDVIVDVTGVPLVDTYVAQTLLHFAAAAHLLGARVLLAGIRPEVAQTIVALGIDLSHFTTAPTIESAVAAIAGRRAQA